MVETLQGWLLVPDLAFRPGIGVGLILEVVKPVFSHNPLAVTVGIALLGGALGAGISDGLWKLHFNGKEFAVTGSQ